MSRLYGLNDSRVRVLNTTKSMLKVTHALGKGLRVYDDEACRTNDAIPLFLPHLQLWNDAGPMGRKVHRL